jgi:hypothetical protein
MNIQGSYSAVHKFYVVILYAVVPLPKLSSVLTYIWKNRDVLLLNVEQLVKKKSYIRGFVEDMTPYNHSVTKRMIYVWNWLWLYTDALFIEFVILFQRRAVHTY